MLPSVCAARCFGAYSSLSREENVEIALWSRYAVRNLIMDSVSPAVLITSLCLLYIRLVSETGSTVEFLISSRSLLIRWRGGSMTALVMVHLPFQIPRWRGRQILTIETAMPMQRLYRYARVEY